MANPSPSYRWKRGQSGNVRGREKSPAEIVTAKTFCRQDILNCLQILLLQPYEQVQMQSSLNQNPVLESLLASIISGAVERGCKMRFNFLLNLIFGRRTKPSKAGIRSTDTKLDDEDVFYMVELNSNGRFMHPRPRKIVQNTNDAFQIYRSKWL